ncbi:MAG: transposase [Bacteroidota bacterium]|nr:transposase [Bacteroidota bacterium]
MGYDTGSVNDTHALAPIALQTNGKWYIHSNTRKGHSDRHRFRRYMTPGCKQCPVISQCTRSAKNGRAIDRSEYADIIEANNQRVNENPDYYRQRQQITEHQFGTIKRQMGYTHTNIRGKLPMNYPEASLRGIIMKHSFDSPQGAGNITHEIPRQARDQFDFAFSVRYRS